MVERVENLTSFEEVYADYLPAFVANRLNAYCAYLGLEAKSMARLARHVLSTKSIPRILWPSFGEVPERPNGLDSKSSERASVPRVRIPPSPPDDKRLPAKAVFFIVCRKMGTVMEMPGLVSEARKSCAKVDCLRQSLRCSSEHVHGETYTAAGQAIFSSWPTHTVRGGHGYAPFLTFDLSSAILSLQFLWLGVSCFFLIFPIAYSVAVGSMAEFLMFVGVL